MNKTTNWQHQPWIHVVACAVILFLNHVADCRRHEKCMTYEGRQGLCVVKRYCREASTNPSDLSHCGNSQEFFCCPVPTARSAVMNLMPYSSSTTTTSTTTTTTPQPNRKPSTSREWQENRKKDDRAERRHQQKNDGNNRSYPRPSPDEDYDEERRYISQSRPRAPSSEARDSEKRHRGYDEQDRVRTQLKYPSEVGQEFLPRTEPPASPIKFPGYETSRPQPAVPACGVKPYDLFIAGGEESREHEWPWMTAIFKRHLGTRPNTFLCGGSLINSRYVLSAAHCFVHNYVILPASSFVVRLGSHYLDSGEDYTVSTVVVHHNHSGSDFFNDIALVRLASEVYFTDKIAPVCLPFESMQRQSFVGRMATVSGWGDTSFRTSGTRILQHVTVPIVSSEECSAAYSRVRGAAFLARGSDHVICAGLREGGKDACLGDSGGPLLLKDDDERWIVIGVVSLGYKCAEPGYPGVYTRVTHYMNWIHINMKRH